MQTVLCNILHRFQRDESGVGLIEFALGAMVLLMIVFAIMDGSRALYVDHFLSNAAREATRYAMVRGSGWNGASCTSPSTFSCTATSGDVTNFVKSITPLGFSADNLTVTTTWPGTTPAGDNCNSMGGNNSQGCIVSVQINYAFNFVLPLMPQNTLVLTSTSAVAIAQ